MSTLSSRRPWPLVTLLFATATAGYLCRANMSIAGVQLMPEFGLTQAELGRVFSAFLLGYALFQMPGGYLADRWGAARVLALLPWLWVALTLAVAGLGVGPFAAAGASGVGALLGLRFLMGAAAGPTYPAAAQAVSQWVPVSARATANGWVIASVGFGSALAPVLISSVMSRWGWRASLVASALPALAVALIWPLVPRKREQLPFADDLRREKRADGEATALKSARFALLTLSYSLQGYVGYIFVFWFYLYLVQERGFDLLSGALFSSLPWILSMAAIPSGGALADRLARGRLGPRWGRRIVPLAGMCGAGAFLSLGAGTSNAYVAALALAVSTALVLSVEGPFWATMNALAGPRSGLGGGIMNTGCNIGGLISPALTPALAASIGWAPALHVAAGLSIVSGLLWLWIRE